MGGLKCTPYILIILVYYDNLCDKTKFKKIVGFVLFWTKVISWDACTWMAPHWSSPHHKVNKIVESSVTI